MAQRVSESDVRGIIDHDPCVSLKPFIRTANILTDKVASQDVDGELGTDLLKEIELYLSAHFYGHRDQLFQSKSTDGASASFQGKTGMFLTSTQYGQTAMMLDVTGYLRSLDTGITPVELTWLGTECDSTRFD